MQANLFELHYIRLIQSLSDDFVRNLVNNHQLVYHSSGIIIIFVADLLQ